MAGDALHIHHATDLLDVGLDYVHANAAPRDVGDPFGCRKSGEEDEVQRFALRHAGGVIRRDRAAFDRFSLYPIDIDSRTIVADLDVDLPAFMEGSQRQSAFQRLSRLLSLLWQLDAVIDRVANEMSQRVLDRLDNRLVQLGVGPLHVNPHLFSRS